MDTLLQSTPSYEQVLDRCIKHYLSSFPAILRERVMMPIAREENEMAEPPVEIDWPWLVGTYMQLDPVLPQGLSLQRFEADLRQVLCIEILASEDKYAEYLGVVHRIARDYAGQLDAHKRKAAEVVPYRMPWGDIYRLFKEHGALLRAAGITAFQLEADLTGQVRTCLQQLNKRPYHVIP